VAWVLLGQVCSELPGILAGEPESLLRASRLCRCAGSLLRRYGGLSLLC